MLMEKSHILKTNNEFYSFINLKGVI